MFDLDDTLYPEIDYCKSGFRVIAAKIASDFALDANLIYDYIWQKFTAGERANLFNQLLDAFSIEYDSQYIGQLVKVYREHNPQITLPKKSFDILGKLKKKYTLALLSDGFLPAQQLKVKSLGIENYFSCIIYTEKLGREYWKPSTKGFEMILTTLGLEGSECVYVADNPIKDFIGPNRLGFLTVHYYNRDSVHHNEPQSDTARPDIVIEDMADLSEVIEQLKGKE